MKKIILTIIISIISITGINYSQQNQLTREQLIEIQNAANNNIPEAQVFWGDTLNERGVTDKALEYYQRAFSNSESRESTREQAARKIAETYYSNGSKQLAGRWLIESANMGNNNSAFILSMMYLNGDGTGVNNTQAYRWLKQASTASRGQYYQLLGQMYLTGRGTTKDDKKGIEYLDKAVEQNNYIAMIILGTHLKINNRNDEWSESLLRNAAKHTNNFITNYLYSSNSRTFNSTLADKDGERLRINRTRDVDNRVIAYYTQLVNSYPTMNDVIDF